MELLRTALLSFTAFVFALFAFGILVHSKHCIVAAACGILLLLFSFALIDFLGIGEQRAVDTKTKGKYTRVAPKEAHQP